jgi:hypothetical protein
MRTCSASLIASNENILRLFSLPILPPGAHKLLHYNILVRCAHSLHQFIGMCVREPCLIKNTHSIS